MLDKEFVRNKTFYGILCQMKFFVKILCLEIFDFLQITFACVVVDRISFLFEKWLTHLWNVLIPFGDLISIFNCFLVIFLHFYFFSTEKKKEKLICFVENFFLRIYFFLILYANLYWWWFYWDRIYGKCSFCS